jgi:hypothetical protein
MAERAEKATGEATFPLPRPHPRPACPDPGLGDLRFRALIGEQGWAALPAAVRERFGHRVAGGAAIVYCGETVECRMSPAGRLLAMLGRLIGGPLPLSRDVFVPAIVTVTEDAATGGQFWTRIYGRRRGFPQVIHSCKRFAGRTGLEEYVGRGVGIALRVRVEDGALHFLSDHYFLGLAGRRLRLPRWLSPGALKVSHIDRGGGWFAFVLSLRHPVLGELIRQTAVFRERATA